MVCTCVRCDGVMVWICVRCEVFVVFYVLKPSGVDRLEEELDSVTVEPKLSSPEAILGMEQRLEQEEAELPLEAGSPREQVSIP